jgi:hypothetical protein
MEISTGNPTLLKQRDIQAPYVAIIADVRLETLTDRRGNQDEQYVVYFTTGKPMKFNVINRSIVVAAYGKQREDWIGKPIEIYVDPNVYMGAERTGGIRVSIPTDNSHRHAAAPASPPSTASKPAPRPAADAGNGTAPALKPTPQPLAAEKARALEGFRRADTTENLDRWWRWADSLPFDDEARAELSRAYVAAQERIALASAPVRRPAPAR